jgi:hypothetical protein
MKKVIMCVMLAVMLIMGVTAYAWGNQSWFDTTWSFEYVQIAMPDGSVVQGSVQSWKDYEDSDVVQVQVNDKVYLTHYMNVVLISE